MINSSATYDKLFQSHHNKEKASHLRTITLLVIFLYLCYAVVDFALSAGIENILLVRGSVVLIMLFILAYTYHGSSAKNYDFLFSSVCLVAAVGTEVTIYLLAPGSQAAHSGNIYLASLILLVMLVFSWSYLKLLTSVFTSLAITGSYAYLSQNLAIPSAELSMNVLFLLSASSIGIVSQTIRNRFLKNSYRLQEALKKSVEEKRVEANHDALTGLPNRRYMTHLLEMSLVKAKQKQDKTLVVMFVDLNGFKQINDQYGHRVGDKVLIIIAKRLSLAVRSYDSISRLGGDEYVIGLMVKNKNISKVEKIAEKYVDIISSPIRIDNIKMNISASIGVAVHPRDGRTIDALINTADKKMYLKKYSHRASVSSRTENRVAPKLYVVNSIKKH